MHPATLTLRDMYLRNLLRFSSFVLLGSAAAATHVLKERARLPRDWAIVDAAAPDLVIPLKIALPQARFGELESHLYAVSDPESDRYGGHLSKAEVESLVAPRPESLEAVNAWLKEHGIDDADVVRSPAHDWATINVPVALAESMLDTTFHMWQHTGSGRLAVRTTSYSLPRSVHAHIELVQPTTFFGATRALRSTVHSLPAAPAVQAKERPSERITVPGSNVTVDASCADIITPDCLLELYDAVGYNASAKSGNRIGVPAYLGEYANYQDFQTFYAAYVPEAANATFDYVLVNGGKNDQSPDEAGGEANLDVQYAFGLTYPTPATFWSVGGSPPFTPDALTLGNTNEPYGDWLDFILAQESIPQTISTSFADDEQTVPEAYARRVCAGFAQLGARGVSLIFGSGDTGAGPAGVEVCVSNDGLNRTIFLPQFPSTCPYVTSVGGTQGIPEKGTSFSSGGFSNYFPRPAYQEKAVSKYLKKHVPQSYVDTGLINATGRAFPDVAAQASNFFDYVAGELTWNEGTSAATPAFAGIVSLLNDARLRSGRPPLGWLNPLIYSKNVSATFTDVKKGKNPGCGTSGFKAAAGWDAITGLGTPDFWKLKAIVAP